MIDGKAVIGTQRDIQEVKNAYNAYEELDNINPYSIEDLKRIHGIMTFLTLKDARDFGSGDEGVFGGKTCIFMVPSPNMVPELMNNLFSWLNNCKDELNPLIISSVFHYEFVFIHPFSDGNGRMARLWQNVILSKWRDIFKYVTIFIEFMLKMINNTLEELIITNNNINN